MRNVCNRALRGALLLAGGLPALALAQGVFPPMTTDPQTTPPWAYTLQPPGLKPPADDGKPLQVPGSNVGYTWPQIFDLFSAKDWFPETHPAMPEVVARGRKPDVFACGMCHYPNGMGKPENSSLAGLPAGYIVQQMADYRNGLRRSSESRMRPPAGMLHVGKHTSEAEAKSAADYFARLPYKKWIRLVETDSVPRTAVGLGSLLGLIKDGGSEPIGNRIIEVAEDQELVKLRDDRVGFVAYVPTGSVRKGETLASGAGGKTIQCAVCHGKELKGLGDVPPLAGRSPTYMFRQLYDIKSGARDGPGAQLMKAVVEQLSSEEMIALAAYAASRAP